MNDKIKGGIFNGTRKTSPFNRIVAKGIDLLIVLALYFLGNIIWLPLGIGAALIFCLAQDSLGSGQSIGKRVIGLRVVDEERGFSCSVSSSCVRNLPFGLALLFSTFPQVWILFLLLALPLLILEIYLLLSLDSGVRLGDLMARSVVIDHLENELESHAFVE